MLFEKQVTRLKTDFKEIPLGFSYLWKGFYFLATHKKMWLHLIAPVVINTLLFSFLFWAVVFLLKNFIVVRLPTTWWGIILMFLVIVAGIVLFLVIAVSLFAVVGSIIAAPFYETIAVYAMGEVGGKVKGDSWWKANMRSIRNAAALLWWYVLVQASLLVLNIVPFVVGPFSYTLLAFFSTALFLAIEFLDFPFEFQKWPFSKRKEWCMHHKGGVIGFGTAIFIGLAFPGFNILVPPAAVVGGVILFEDLNKKKK